MTRPIVGNVLADYMQVAQADRTYLYMNFTRSYRSHLLTTVRTSVANILDSTGIINGAIYSAPRINDLGLIVEESSANVSADLGSWTTLASTVTFNSVLAPNDRIEAETITDDLTTAFHGITRTPFSGDTTTPITISLFVKMGTARYFQISMVGSGTNSQHYANFDLLNGIMGNIGSNASGTITMYSNGWCRCSMTFVPINVSSSMAIRAGMVSANNSAKIATFLGTGLNTVHVWGPQVEAKGYVTSYIGSMSTRDQDLININDLTLPTEFTLYIEVYLDKDTSKKQTLFSLDDGTNSNSLYAERTAAGSVSVIWRQASSNVWTQSFTSKTGARFIRLGISYSGGNWKVFCDSEAQTQSGTISSTLNSIHLGCAGNNTSFLDGVITKIAIYNTELTNFELSQLTSLVDLGLHQSSLLLENGDFFLLEDASYLLLE